MNGILMLAGALAMQITTAPTVRMRVAPPAVVPLTKAAARSFDKYFRPLEVHLQRNYRELP